MRIAIIGGSGKMGRWFAAFLRKEGKGVVITGRDQSKLEEAGRQLGVETASNADAVKSADAVVLSVPIDSFEPIVREISSAVKAGQSVIDVTSVKMMPVDIMHRYLKKARVLGTHPLFGPGAKGVANQNFVLTPTNAAEAELAEKVKEFLEPKKARVTVMTPQEHDEMMTVILGLSHFVAIVSADTLLSSDKLEKMEAIGGITYKVLLTLVESVLTEDPGLYASLQMNLPGVAGVERLFQGKAREWADIVAHGDRQQFMRRMETLRKGLQGKKPDFGKAYENLYKIADGM